MLITVASVLALVPCSGFVQRSWAGASRTVTRAKSRRDVQWDVRLSRPPVSREAEPDGDVLHLEQDRGQKSGGLVLSASAAPPWLFHFTTRENAREIMEDSRLRASNKNARFGDGIYFTSLPPWADSDAIIDNNYRGS